MSASWQLNRGGVLILPNKSRAAFSFSPIIEAAFSFSPIIEAAFSFSPSFSLGFSLRCTPENHLNGFQRFWHGVTPSLSLGRMRRYPKLKLGENETDTFRVLS